VAARREHLGDARGLETRFSAAHRRAHARSARAEQVVLVDVTYDHSAETTKDSHYRLKPPAAAPRNWRAPVDYASGTAHVHLEVMTKPSTAGTKFQICFTGETIKLGERSSVKGLNPLKLLPDFFN
jgi:hypothetical protein